MFKAIIFDFDGVITESNDIKTRAFGKLFQKEGREVVDKIIDYHLKNMGVSRYEKFKYYYQEILKRPLDEETFNSLGDRFGKLVKEGVIKAPYIKGAKEFIEDFSDQYSYFICSATPRAEIKEIAKEKGISGYFKEIYGSPAKKIDLVQKIIFTHQFKPAELVYVGDALGDYEAAQAHEVFFIARVGEDNNFLFQDIDCPKIENLESLHLVIKK